MILLESYIANGLHVWISNILVLEDMLGLSDWTPKFVRKFGNLSGQIEGAVRDYAEAVRSGDFPSMDHVYKPKK